MSGCIVSGWMVLCFPFPLLLYTSPSHQSCIVLEQGRQFALIELSGHVFFCSLFNQFNSIDCDMHGGKFYFSHYHFSVDQKHCLQSLVFAVFRHIVYAANKNYIVAMVWVRKNLQNQINTKNDCRRYKFVEQKIPTWIVIHANSQIDERIGQYECLCVCVCVFIADEWNMCNHLLLALWIRDWFLIKRVNIIVILSS